MYYYASLNANGVCFHVGAYEEEQETNAYTIQLDSLDTSLVYRKKYVAATQSWVDCLPSETGLPMSDRVGYSPTDQWLSDVLGNITSLSTTSKTSLVAAVNECFQSASDGISWKKKELDFPNGGDVFFDEDIEKLIACGYDGRIKTAVYKKKMNLEETINYLLEITSQ